MDYLSVKNWEDFQHYKDRNPPWIKLHRSLLNDYQFSRLQDASKLHLMLIWLLASQVENKIPMDTDWIKGQTGIRGKLDLKPLIDSGFLIASTTLADCKQVASFSDSDSVSVCSSNSKEPSKKRASRIPDDWQPSDALLEWAAKKFPAVDAMYQAEAFKDHWASSGSKTAIKSDWDAAFRTWIRKSDEYRNANGAVRPNTRTETASQRSDRIARELAASLE